MRWPESWLRLWPSDAVTQGLHRADPSQRRKRSHHRHKVSLWAVTHGRHVPSCPLSLRLQDQPLPSLPPGRRHSVFRGWGRHGAHPASLPPTSDPACPVSLSEPCSHKVDSAPFQERTKQQTLRGQPPSEKEKKSPSNAPETAFGAPPLPLLLGGVGGTQSERPRKCWVWPAFSMFFKNILSC